MSKSKPPEPPPSPKRPSKHILGGTHDDPIVVDNGPVRVDFRQPAQQDGQTFKRMSAGLKLLIAAIVDRNGVRERIVVRRLNNKPITMMLKDERGEEKLVFQVRLGKLVVEQEHDTFELSDDGRDLKPTGGRQLRIVQIHHDSELVLDARSGDPTQRTVIAALIPKDGIL